MRTLADRQRPTVTETLPRQRARRRRARTSAKRANLDDYGLLRTVLLVDHLETGRTIRDLLGTAGVRATVATGNDGLTRVLVFPDEYDRARRMVNRVL
nr:hypothetical protein [Planosporangium flavigriseum]